MTVKHNPVTETASPLQGASATTFESLISRFAEITEDATQPGVTRLAYTALERHAHSMFADHMANLGLKVWHDSAGNTIAEKAGAEPNLPAIGTGSHLDSVPRGGRYDGIAGVVAGMEVARLFAENNVVHHHPLRFVAFASEEGARFGQACIGSRIAAGMTHRGDLDSLADSTGITVAQAMRSVGINPDSIDDALWRSADWAAFLELHIEQGSVLASRGIPLGIVDLISGSTRLRMTLHGRASHTGGTPMHLRADALAASAEIVLQAEALATDSRHHGTRITVGKLSVEPGSITTIPGKCTLSIDIRDIDSDRQRQAATELISFARQVADSRNVSFEVDLLADASPVLLPKAIRDCIVTAGNDLGVQYRLMPSGASHDSQMINRICPVGMIFVPSQNQGVSHSPDEFSMSADLARGTEVLAAAILAVDKESGPDHFRSY